MESSSATNTLNDRQCPVCDRFFKTSQGMRAHLKHARSCKWYGTGKLKEMAELFTDGENADHEANGQDPVIDSGLDEDRNGELVWDWDDGFEELQDHEEMGDLSHFIPLLTESQLGEAGPGPQTQTHLHARLQRVLDDDDDERVEEVHATAGRVLRNDLSSVRLAKVRAHRKRALDKDGDTDMDTEENVEENPYAPFRSEIDWLIAQWAIKDDIRQNSLDRLLEIPQVKERLGLSYHNVRSLLQLLDKIPERAGSWTTKTLAFGDRLNDRYTIRHRDPIQAIQSLWSNPAHVSDLVYAPKKIFTNQSKSDRIYSEMWTGHWWHAVQSRLPVGATVAPIIIATDKTQLTQFSGSKSAYPVYLTIGNLPKAIRRKPTQQACILLAYLSVDKVDRTQMTDNEHRSRVHRIFHESMRIILQPLKEAGKTGVEMTSADGNVRKVYPVLASYVADYPEQCLVTCSKYGTCPKCQCSAKSLGDDEAHMVRTSIWTLSIFSDAKQSTTSPAAFAKYCMAQGVSGGVFVPFWKDFPHCDIHLTITPDVLHQIYQGVFKHLVTWCQKIINPAELDRRIRVLPPTSGLRHFKKGIQCLSQFSGSERKAMAKILLPCLVGRIPNKGIAAIKALLDFTYLAQYSTHDSTTLQYLDDALQDFHQHKDYFIQKDVRDHLHIPKFHSLTHYVDSIKLLGTTDNYNTEAFERFHIDYAKHGWRASNHRNEFPQMIRWLSRQEKVTAFNAYLESSSVTRRTPLGPQRVPPKYLAKYPDNASKPLSAIESTHKAPQFTMRLKEFLNQLLPANQATSNRVAQDYSLPFTSLDVYHMFRFSPESLQDDDEERDIVKAIPWTARVPDGRFDTVVVMARDDAESTGLAGTRIARVKVIFKLPEKINTFLGTQDSPSQWPKGPLAFVEWYSLSSKPDKYHGMYTAKHLYSSTGSRQTSIISLSRVRQSCMLVPIFSPPTILPTGIPPEEKDWTANNVLDRASSFVVNNWVDMYTYQTIW